MQTIFLGGHPLELFVMATAAKQLCCVSDSATIVIVIAMFTRHNKVIIAKVYWNRWTLCNEAPAIRGIGFMIYVGERKVYEFINRKYVIELNFLKLSISVRT